MLTFKHNLIGLLTIASILLAIILAVLYSSNLPTVEYSYSNKSCIKVISLNNKHDCENLPIKYHHTWVK